MKRKNIWVGVITAAFAMMTVGMLFPQVKFQNLQALPKDIAPDDLKATMKGYTEQLGVKCDFCHDVDAGYDKDVKNHKLQARRMIRLLDEMRGSDKYFTTDEEKSKIDCWVCHRGSAHIEKE